MTTGYLQRIESLVEKVEDWSRLPAEPLVSVYMITYNHESYIREALDSVLMQQVSFTYEIVIGEDKSTDCTREIVCEYQRQHPDKIRLRLARENLYSQGFKPGFGVLNACRGKYIALCEGDDYWTDPLKLQKQVDIFQSYPECIICGARAKTWNEVKGEFTGITPPREKSIACMTGEQFCHLGSWVKTCTRMVPREFMRSVPPEYLRDMCQVHYLLAKNPERTVRCLDEIVAVYREHPGGVFSGADPIQLLQRQFIGYRLIAKLYTGEKSLRYGALAASMSCKLRLADKLSISKRLFYAWHFARWMVRQCWIEGFSRLRYRPFVGRKTLKIAFRTAARMANAMRRNDLV